ncbi:hypothetical protein GDO86_012705 [Hymenochirus boettgeri]|uniref:Uncharacterized protein n=1 Tax=Hymenochirus boettgeri TaxID=247094 RepID=A0A8T2IW89_9PIPI|nr:hypothetical protein GDO86_012705 [Hymenochirus boettgeri]
MRLCNTSHTFCAVHSSTFTCQLCSDSAYPWKLTDNIFTASPGHPYNEILSFQMCLPKCKSFPASAHLFLLYVTKLVNFFYG